MTRTKNTLHIGAALLLAGSLIFTSFQTFAEDFAFDTDPFAWGEVQDTITVAEAPVENAETPSVSIIPDAAVETTDSSVWDDVSTTDTFISTESESATSITNEAVTDNSVSTPENVPAQTDQEYSCPCGDKLLDANGRYAGYCSYQSGDDRVTFHYSDRTKCPLANTEPAICTILRENIEQWFLNEISRTANDFFICVRNVPPCRESMQCETQSVLREICRAGRVGDNTAIVNEKRERIANLPSFCR